MIRTVVKSLVVACLICSPPVTVNANGDVEGADDVELNVLGFDEIASVLTGTWVGQYTNGTFKNPGEDWAPVTVEYRLTARGTALVEDYIYGEDLRMTTVYYKDNGGLRLTHYCGAGNHPRMNASSDGRLPNSVRFDFVDITNLQSPEDYHSRELHLTIVDENNVQILYNGLRHGETLSQAYSLSRQSQATEIANAL